MTASTPRYPGRGALALLLRVPVPGPMSAVPGPCLRGPCDDHLVPRCAQARGQHQPHGLAWLQHDMVEVAVGRIDISGIDLDSVCGVAPDVGERPRLAPNPLKPPGRTSPCGLLAPVTHLLDARQKQGEDSGHSACHAYEIGHRAMVGRGRMLSSTRASRRVLAKPGRAAGHPTVAAAASAEAQRPR
jgi:hypothetical protein